MHARG